MTIIRAQKRRAMWTLLDRACRIAHVEYVDAECKHLQQVFLNMVIQCLKLKRLLLALMQEDWQSKGGGIIKMWL